jgi:hypothetical protein
MRMHSYESAGVDKVTNQALLLALSRISKDCSNIAIPHSELNNFISGRNTVLSSGLSSKILSQTGRRLRLGFS